MKVSLIPQAEAWGIGGTVVRSLKVSMENASYKRLRESKALVEYVMGEALDWDTYVGLLLDLGLKKVIEDVTGSSDNPVLKGTLQTMHQQNPAFVTGFIVDTLKRGSEENRQEIKGKLGFLK